MKSAAEKQENKVLSWTAATALRITCHIRMFEAPVTQSGDTVPVEPAPRQQIITCSGTIGVFCQVALNPHQ